MSSMSESHCWYLFPKNMKEMNWDQQPDLKVDSLKPRA